MTMLVEQRSRLELRTLWPQALHPDVLATVDAPTPFLICDLDTIRDRYRELSAALPGVQAYYAMKCNSSAEVLRAVAGLGASFEVASIGELNQLRELGVNPADVLFSNPIKAPAAVAEAHRAGLWRFSFDSEGELRKIAELAPGSAVYVRLRVDDSTSVFPLSRKFGAEATEARALMGLARHLGLRTYGVTFHVGSQCASPNAWRQAIAAAGRLMSSLQRDGIHLEMLDMGGGFPARYGHQVPTIDQIGAAIMSAVDELLPCRPMLAVEPGRHLVAESAVMVASVLGREVRANENWIYLDVGAYNGLMETQQSVNQWAFPMWSSCPDHATGPKLAYTVSGPSCDSSDTMFYGVALPASIDVGDRVYIGVAGAYTLSYASTFNGFPIPARLFVGG
jgi:ornithine decarboxylase